MRLFSDKKHSIFSFSILLSLFVLTGCKKELPLTTLEIEDPVRTYYPVLQGQKQNIVVKITNTGESPLKIKDVLPSCGCTVATFPNAAIRPGEHRFIEMEYNSNKNIGDVRIYTTILANTKEESHTFIFNINVVPNALYTPDYEELYHIEEKENKGLIQEMVDGKANERGYIIDSTEVRKFK